MESKVVNLTETVRKIMTAKGKENGEKLVKGHKVSVM